MVRGVHAVFAVLFGMHDRRAVRLLAASSIGVLVVGVVVAASFPVAPDAADGPAVPPADSQTEPSVLERPTTSSAEAASSTTVSTAPPERPPVGRDLSGRPGDVAPEDPAVVAAAVQAIPPPAPARIGPRPAVNDHDLPDPAVAFADGRFFVFATNSGGRNISMVSSADLKHWTEPVDAAPSLPSWGRRDVTWAPAVGRLGDRWVLYAAVMHGGLGRHCIAAFTSPHPAEPFGPAAEPLVCGSSGAIDPAVTVDGDRALLHWKAVGGRSRQIFGAPLSGDGLGLAGPPVHVLTNGLGWEGGGVENPAMVQTPRGWRLFYSANWWTDARYATGVANCDGPLGPCRKSSVPFVSSKDGPIGPGGLSVTVDDRGRPWAAYHAWSPVAGYAAGGHRNLHVEPLDLDGSRPAFANRSPAGAFAGWLRVPGGVLVAGWAADPDTGHPITVDLVAGGRTFASALADRPDEALAESRPRTGPDHGYLTLVRLGPGSHRLCARARDDAGAGHADIGCHDVVVSGTPFGTLADPGISATSTRLDGWAIDPDSSGAVTVRALLDGRVVAEQRADRQRPEVAEAHPGYGPDHGFSMAVQVPSGRHELCVQALDTSSGAPRTLRCITVDQAVPQPPVDPGPGPAPEPPLPIN